MFCGLREEERTRFSKKKSEKDKKTKSKTHRGQKWVGSDDLKTYKRMKYFLPYLTPFLSEIAFQAKLSGRLSCPETEVTWLVASKFDTNIQLINHKVLSKFLKGNFHQILFFIAVKVLNSKLYPEAQTIYV